MLKENDLSIHAPTRTLSAAETYWERLEASRRDTDELFEMLPEETLAERPIAERHRILFYIGHLEAFDLNLFQSRVAGVKSFDPEFDQLFAFGIDPVGGGLPDDRVSDWPSIANIRNYAQRVRDSLDPHLQAAISLLGEPDRRGTVSETFSVLETLLHTAIEHRLMHVETLAYMLHQLPAESKRRPSRVARLITSGWAAPNQNRPITVPAGSVLLGSDAAGPDEFAWDNERDAHWVRVPEFRIDRYPVTNRDFLRFVREGGYQERSLWSDADWAWRTAEGITHPCFWASAGEDRWNYRGMFEEIPLPEDWPVYVSHAEASAFARWSGKQLPTEAQWQRAAYGDGEQPYPWGSEPPSDRLGNFDCRRFDPVAVTSHPQGASPFGVEDMLGNGWEWTSSEFAPFEGFAPYSFYPGYSADFFDGKHYVIKGGSAQTGACMLRRSFRNWFQPHYRYVYAGFRCVSR